MSRARRRSAAALLAALPLGCVEVALDNPQRYDDVPPSERLAVPCYYALDAGTEASVVEDMGYRVKLGPAVAGQLQAALGGLCRGTGRVRDPAEFAAVAGSDPSLLVEVQAAAEMDARAFTWAVNTGSVRGRASVRGLSEISPRGYDFTAAGAKRQYYAEAGSGAEGLRRALGDAVQDLVNRMRADRAALEAMAPRAAAPPP